MRKGLEEFPSESELQMCLAYALRLKWSEEGEKTNIYLEEAAALYEEVKAQIMNNPKYAVLHEK